MKNKIIFLNFLIFIIFSINFSYSESRFAGCIIRDQNEYWNQYMSHEIGQSLYVLTTTTTSTNTTTNTTNKTTMSKILGWISIRKRSSSRIQIRDFGLDLPYFHHSSSTSMSMLYAMELLLYHTIQSILCKEIIETKQL